MDSTTKEFLLIGGVVGAAYLLLKGGIDQLTGNTPEERQATRVIDQVVASAGNPWDPNFYKKAQAEGHDVLLMTRAAAMALGRELLHTVGFYRDDFPRAFAVFKKMKTQTQLSFLADVFQADQGKSLIAWLQGWIWPQDHFSEAQVAQIINYIKGLPKYEV